MAQLGLVENLKGLFGWKEGGSDTVQGEVEKLWQHDIAIRPVTVATLTTTRNAIVYQPKRKVKVLRADVIPSTAIATATSAVTAHNYRFSLIKKNLNAAGTATSTTSIGDKYVGSVTGTMATSASVSRLTAFATLLTATPTVTLKNLATGTMATLLTLSTGNQLVFRVAPSGATAPFDAVLQLRVEEAT